MVRSEDIVLSVNHVGKFFKLPTEASNGIKQAFINWTKGIKGYKKQQVLDDISFQVERGDFLGIVGRNGCGKSTLLKLISGIYTPDSGNINVNGTLVPFIELGVGFNPELTGRENIYLNGAMLGFTEKQIDDMYDDIVNFAELGDFMDQKLKNYSSGMQVRLAFSVAIQAKSDILVLDEVLAVGDEAFQKKCNDYFYQVKKEGRTVILVTHSMPDVRRFCNKAIFINNGKIEASGSPDKVADAYSNLFRKEYADKLQAEELKKVKREAKRNELSDIKLKNIKLKDGGKSSMIVDFREDFDIELTLESKTDHSNLEINMDVVDQAGKPIVIMSSRVIKGKTGLHEGINTLRFTMENILSEGDYSINVIIDDKDNGVRLMDVNNASKFTVVGMDIAKYNVESLVYPKIEIEIVK